MFWTRLSLQAATFGVFTLLTFLVVYGVFRALKPDRLDALMGATILINRRPVKLPVEPVLKLIGLGLSVAIAAVTGASMMERWMTLALFWDAPRRATMLDPIFGRSLDFYLFTLPALPDLISGWLLTLSVIACLIAAVFVVVTGGARILTEWRSSAAQARLWRGLSISLAALFLMLAVRVYLGRFENLFQDGTVFAGVTYTDANVTLRGALVICAALVVGAAGAGLAAVFAPRPRWLVAIAVPAIACYLIVAAVRWYVSGFIVAPNQLVRERPFIAHNMEYDTTGLRTRPHPEAPVSRRHWNRGGPAGQQPDDTREHTAVGLASVAGYAPSDSGNPNLL